MLLFLDFGLGWCFVRHLFADLVWLLDWFVVVVVCCGLLLDCLVVWS